MKKIRLWSTAVAASTVLAAGIVIETPANAAANPSTIYVSSCASNPVVRDQANGGGSVITNVTFTLFSSLLIDSECTGGSQVKVSSFFIPEQTLRATGPSSYNATSLTSNQTLTFKGVDNSTTQVTLTLSGGGGGGGTSSDSVESAPVEVSLSLDLAASGASCKEGSAATGTVGQWLTLPGADDCTSTTRSDAKLLGWSTSKDFPVTIAQRQVSNGWGSYELTNESGEVTAVFIPAGGATFVSSGNSLYPIWAR